ncbi:MAG TPA: type II secretion system F family protein [Chthoniobacteraceae bacterium]
MPLSHREKQSFYHHLGQLLRSGVALPKALDKLALTSRGGAQRLVKQLRDSIGSGATIGEAFAAARPAVSRLEATVIDAVDRTGRLEHGMKQLADSYAALATARALIFRKAAYPIFVLHFGIFALALPTLLSAGLHPYLRETGMKLLVFYVIGGAALLAGPLLRDAGSVSPGTDRLLRMIPLLGKTRRAFALARFCLVYDLQLGAGVNIFEALQTAGKASRSGLILHAVERAIPQVRAGDQVGPLLAASNAFPPEMMRTLLVAEETGELDRELPRLTAEYQAESLRRVETAADWLSKLIYIVIVLYLAWSIIGSYVGVLSSYEKALGI